MVSFWSWVVLDASATISSELLLFSFLQRGGGDILIVLVTRSVASAELALPSGRISMEYAVMVADDLALIAESPSKTPSKTKSKMAKSPSSTPAHGLNWNTSKIEYLIDLVDQN